MNIVTRNLLARLCVTGALVAPCAACTESPIPCSTTSECFRGEVCAGGFCERDGGATPTTGSNNSVNNPANNQTTPRTNNQTSTTPGTTSANNTSPAGPVCLNSPGACLGEEPQEGSSFFKINPEGRPRVSCADHGEPGTVTFETQLEGIVCPSDSGGDSYSVEFAFCPENDFQIKMVVRPDDPECPDTAYDIDFSPSVCTGTTVVCTTEVVGGAVEFTMFVARVGSAVGPPQTIPLSIGRSESRAPLRLPYTIDVTVTAL